MLSALLGREPSQQKLRVMIAAAVSAAVVTFIIGRRFFSSSSSSSKKISAKKINNKPIAVDTSSFAKDGLKVTQLFLYPIKSAGAVPVPPGAAGWPLTKYGLLYDREWVVIRDDGSRAILTQRQCPQMRLIQPSITADDKATLNISLPATSGGNKKEVVVSVSGTKSVEERMRPESDFRVYSVTLWGISGEVLDEGDEAAEALSAFLETPVRLCRVSRHRVPSTSAWHKSLFEDSKLQAAAICLHDFSSLHLITEESLEHVRTTLAEQQKSKNGKGIHTEPVDALRFRPNLVVEGAGRAGQFEEDCWKRIVVGDNGIVITVAKHCGRCSIPTLDSQGARDPSYFPTSGLKQTRNAFYTHQKDDDADIPPGKQRWPMFGLNVFHEMPAGEDAVAVKLKVGDKVAVKEFEVRDVLEFEK